MLSTLSIGLQENRICIFSSPLLAAWEGFNGVGALEEQSSDSLKEKPASCIIDYLYSSNPWVYSAQNNRLVNVGDSIYGYSKINEFLQEKLGFTYPTFATSACWIWESYPFKPSVRNQYALAIGSHHKIDTIIMNGGANDILIPGLIMDTHDCKTPLGGKLSASCRTHIHGIGRCIEDIWRMMDSDGVRNIFYLGYHHPKGGVVGCTDLQDGELNAALDYASKVTQAAIVKVKGGVDPSQRIKANLYFVDMRPIILKEDIIEDGLHLSESGSRKVADLLYNTLVEHGCAASKAEQDAIHDTILKFEDLTIDISKSRHDGPDLTDGEGPDPIEGR